MLEVSFNSLSSNLKEETMLLSDSVIINFATWVAIFLTIVILFHKCYFLYWKNLNVEYLEPKIPFGNLPELLNLNKQTSKKFKEVYAIAKKKGWKHVGVFVGTSTIYIPVDLDLIKNIMARDFQYFVDRGSYYNEKDDPLSAHLINIGGTKWKTLRTKLSPTFTAGKMKMMFQTFVECEISLVKKMNQECDKGAAIDIKTILESFTTDVIGSCAFGLDCKMLEDEDSPFRQFSKKIFDVSLARGFKEVFSITFPHISRTLGLRQVPKDIADFFMKIVAETVKYREDNNVTRKDFLQLLIDMKNNKSGEADTLTIEEIAAQCYGFFFAGFETSATTMAFVLYELATHQDVQTRVRNEIETVLANHEGKITYEAIQEIKYMNQVIDETFRLHPPVAMTPRKCGKDYNVPGTNAIIKKGTKVIISILGIHHDEDIYPDPETFDPERFSEKNKSQRHSYSHIPFGEGPRICIGMRFGLVQTKVGLTSLLKNFHFTVNPKTREPLVMHPRSIVQTPLGGIWLNAQKIQ